MDQDQRQQPENDQLPANQPPTLEEPIVTSGDVVAQFRDPSEASSTPASKIESSIENEPENESITQPETQTQSGEPADSQITTSTNPSETTAATTAPTETNSASEPRNFLAAFLLLVLFGYLGLHQVYLGNKTQGWVRFGLGIAAIPLSIVFIGFLIAAVLGVWTIVDFFKLYAGKRVDREGLALAVNNRDSHWAKAIFIIVLAIGALNILGILAAFALGLFASIQNAALDTTQQQDYIYEYQYNID